jgi:predicted 3-demethylubiquinone-9 3-methyltransferase (glyoxalase superfamily)
MKPYTSLFPNAAIYFSQTYKALEEQPEGNLKFGHFSLNNEIFAAMDGTGNLSFTFNEVVSLVVECDTLEDIDNHRAKLTKGGEESMCSWKTSLNPELQTLHHILDTWVIVMAVPVE